MWYTYHNEAVELFETGFLEKKKLGTYESLVMIHKYLFDEIYDFAGKLRKVNISICIQNKGTERAVSKVLLELSFKKYLAEKI